MRFCRRLQDANLHIHISTFEDILKELIRNDVSEIHEDEDLEMCELACERRNDEKNIGEDGGD